MSLVLTPLSISDRLEQILSQLSKAITPTFCPPHPHQKLPRHVLHDLTKLENRPGCLTEMAYEWCSTICENYQNLEYRESLLLLSLEIGFRHIDAQNPHSPAELTHTIHHRQLVDIIFESGDGESIADLLLAWTFRENHSGEQCTLLNMCVRHLVGLHQRVPFSSRLRRLVIRSITLIGYRGFEEVGVEGLIEVLNHLHIGIEDTGGEVGWGKLLLDIIQSPEGLQHLSHQYWELLVEPKILRSLWEESEITYNPRVAVSLEEAEEWDKLHYWMGVVWTLWPSETSGTTEDLERAMISLFHQRPGAPQKLKQLVEGWSKEYHEDVSPSFQRIYEQAHEVSQQETP